MVTARRRSGQDHQRHRFPQWHYRDRTARSAVWTRRGVKIHPPLRSSCTTGVSTAIERSHRADLLGHRTHHSRGNSRSGSYDARHAHRRDQRHHSKDEAIPSAEVATNAFNLAVTGERNKVSVSTQQKRTTMTTAAPEEPRRWLRITGWDPWADHHRWGVLRSHAGTVLAVLAITARPRRSTHRASPQCQDCVEAAPSHIAEAL